MSLKRKRPELTERNESALHNLQECIPIKPLVLIIYDFAIARLCPSCGFTTESDGDDEAYVSCGFTTNSDGDDEAYEDHLIGAEWNALGVCYDCFYCPDVLTDICRQCCEKNTDNSEGFMVCEYCKILLKDCCAAIVYCQSEYATCMVCFNKGLGGVEECQDCHESKPPNQFQLICNSLPFNAEVILTGQLICNSCEQ